MSWSYNQIINRLLPYLAFLFGIWYFSIRILGYQLEYIPGDLGDSRFINYLLEHGFLYLKGDISSFWNAEFMYPFQNTIALSDSMLGTLSFYSIWRFIGFSQESSYQLWWLCMCALNYWVAYFVGKKLFSRPLVAMIIAWIFAFSIFNAGQLNYMQMIIRFPVPIVFYAAYKMTTSPSLKYLILYSIGLIIQLYSVAYTGFYLFYFSILFVFVLFVISRKNRRNFFYYFQKGSRFPTSLIIVLSAVILLPMMLHYAEMSKIVGLRLYNEVAENLPVWNSFLFPHESSITWRFLFNAAKPDVSNWWLHYLFPGIIPFVIMIGSAFYLLYNYLLKNNTPLLLKTVGITSLILILLHLRIGENISLYALIFKLPGINSMRVLNRFMHVELFLITILLGFALMKLKVKYLPIVLLLVFMDNLFSPDLIPIQEKSNIIERRKLLESELNEYDLKNYEAVALINKDQPHYVTHLDMMIAAQSAGIASINGYSS